MQTKTDLEIVSALKQCIEDGDCEKCPYDDGYGRAKMCVNEVMTDALNLIIDLNEKYIKRAKWIELNVPTCSNCGYVGYTNFYGRCKTKFCPECGSEMSGTEK